jgi:23S rRNA (pseudouridine1915-N3)-methyltransferase
MTIKIFSVGKKHDSYISTGIEDFTGRLSHYTRLEWHILPPSGADEPTARVVESDSLLKKLSADDVVVLLDERGMMLDSPGLAQKIEMWQNASVKNLVFIIGGAYGVDERIHERADLVWSLSKLVFPHQLVRLMLAEQLYRAHTIIRGEKYHHI